MQLILSGRLAAFGETERPQIHGLQLFMWGATLLGAPIIDWFDVVKVNQTPPAGSQPWRWRTNCRVRRFSSRLRWNRWLTSRKPSFFNLSLFFLGKKEKKNRRKWRHQAVKLKQAYGRVFFPSQVYGKVDEEERCYPFNETYICFFSRQPDL